MDDIKRNIDMDKLEEIKQDRRGGGRRVNRGMEIR